MNKGLIDLIEQWGKLSWLNRKRIGWIRFKSVHKIDNKHLGGMFVLLVIIGIGLFESHIEEAVVAYAVITLLLFYAIAASKLYQVIETTRGK